MNEDRRFIKDRSVFRMWKDDNDEMIRKMFESDMSYSKIHRIVRNNENEMKDVKD